MPEPGVLAFARGALPPPPARVLEIGAGDGDLAAALRDGGYAVTAIDPKAEQDTGVERLALIDASGRYDAALAVVSLHHVEPLAESCARLAELLEPGGVLAIDELDIRRYDERATAWWLHQRRAAGHDDDHTPETILDGMRGHIHALDDVIAALAPHFELGEPVRGAYLHRWHLPPGLRETEERLIGEGRLPATGARLVARRRVSG
ncbi:MAG TPA: class I SAM-dependent methyltransferase [Solirubrobacteraceae bacterium]|nr:class I SAM-dependent methyltransferase [Solirubrobacteraceae bacterium]